MKKKTVRVIFDVLLTIMLVFEMFIQYTGNFLHEVVGFAFFATMMVVQLVWAILFMPETKGGTIEDIERRLGIAE